MLAEKKEGSCLYEVLATVHFQGVRGVFVPSMIAFARGVVQFCLAVARLTRSLARARLGGRQKAKMAVNKKW